MTIDQTKSLLAEFVQPEDLKLSHDQFLRKMVDHLVDYLSQPVTERKSDDQESV
jgi:hypothetical protein